MRQLLIINPNTSASISALLQSYAQNAAGPDVRVRTVTARFGAPYIACEASYAVAAHATLDAWAAALKDDEPAAGVPAPDAVLIGCFGDPGLLALRESCGVPVTGLAEAAFIEAARYGRFAIVTGGARWPPILQRLIHTLGLDAALAGIHAVAPSGAQLAQDPNAAQVLLASACRAAAQHFGAQAVILGGAGLVGIAARIQAQVGVPVIDSVLAGTYCALSQAGIAVPGQGSRFNRFAVAWQGLSKEMAALGLQGGDG
ncbi:MAG: aspartate/glutamate racemase family protein [Pseudomonadota bacterium]